MRLFIVPAVLALTSCNLVQPEIRLGSGQGIPPISGSTEVTLDTFVCGNPIPAGAYTVTTKQVSGGCELSFDKDVEIIGADEYKKIPDLGPAGNLLQAVELKITKLAFTDTTTETVLDPATRVTSAALSVNGQVIGDKSLLSSLPKTVTLSGEALAKLKEKVDRRQPASVHATAVVVLPNDPPPPAKMRIEYDAQPTLVLGVGELKF